MDTLFYMGLIFIFGALTQWLSPKIHLSKVVGYMIMGLILAPHTFSLFPESFVTDVHILIDLALSLIAVLIGASLKRTQMQGMAKQIIVITFFQAFATFIVVTVGIYFLAPFVFPTCMEPLVLSLLLAGVAAATAPAATLAIIQELNARGKFTTILLGVVALDDALALMLFALALTVSEAILSFGGLSFVALYDAFFVIVFSVGLGIGSGLIATAIVRVFLYHKGMQTIATLGMIFVAYSLSSNLKLEPLLTALVMGTVLTNWSKSFHFVEDEIDNHIVEIVFMLFFMLSAMHLDIGTLWTLPLAVITYVLLRLSGKISGSYLGAKVTKSDVSVQRYLGMALLPQAGIAVGLVLSIQQHEGFEAFASLLLNLVIATTIIHEIVGPVMTQYALKKAMLEEDKLKGKG